METTKKRSTTVPVILTISSSIVAVGLYVYGHYYPQRLLEGGLLFFVFIWIMVGCSALVAIVSSYLLIRRGKGKRKTEKHENKSFPILQEKGLILCLNIDFAFKVQ